MPDTNATTLPLAPGAWPADPVHSSVEFTVRHLGISKVRGRFNSFDATLVVGRSLDDTSLEATVDMASVDTNDADRDAHLRSTDFFAVENHPQMTFESTAIRQTGEDEYRLEGDLTVNGVTAPMSLDVEFSGAETYPMDGKLHTGFSARGRLSRKQYGVEFDVPLGADKMAIGDRVDIELEIQLVEPA